jgi:hypothetical protein
MKNVSSKLRVIIPDSGDHNSPPNKTRYLKILFVRGLNLKGALTDDDDVRQIVRREGVHVLLFLASADAVALDHLDLLGAESHRNRCHLYPLLQQTRSMNKRGRSRRETDLRRLGSVRGDVLRRGVPFGLVVVDHPRVVQRGLPVVAFSAVAAGLPAAQPGPRGRCNTTLNTTIPLRDCLTERVGRVESVGAARVRQLHVFRGRQGQRQHLGPRRAATVTRTRTGARRDRPGHLRGGLGRVLALLFGVGGFDGRARRLGRVVGGAPVAFSPAGFFPRVRRQQHALPGVDLFDLVFRQFFHVQTGGVEAERRVFAVIHELFLALLGHKARVIRGHSHTPFATKMDPKQIDFPQTRL